MYGIERDPGKEVWHGAFGIDGHIHSRQNVNGRWSSHHQCHTISLGDHVCFARKFFHRKRDVCVKARKASPKVCHCAVIDRADETLWNSDSDEYLSEIAQPYDGLASGGKTVVVDVSAAE